MEKKLQRDTKNKVIGGVCAGLANYFDIDASLVRLLFAFMFLCASAGFWLYIILWIVMPAGQISQNADYFVSPDGTTEVTEEGKNDSLKTPKSKGSIVAGLILIGIGAIGLLHRYIPEINWDTAWPILLIVLGLFLIIPFNSKKS